MFASIRACALASSRSCNSVVWVNTVAVAMAVPVTGVAAQLVHWPEDRLFGSSSAHVPRTGPPCPVRTCKATRPPVVFFVAGVACLLTAACRCTVFRRFRTLPCTWCCSEALLDTDPFPILTWDCLRLRQFATCCDPNARQLAALNGRMDVAKLAGAKEAPTAGTSKPPGARNTGPDACCGSWWKLCSCLDNLNQLGWSPSEPGHVSHSIAGRGRWH